MKTLLLSNINIQPLESFIQNSSFTGYNQYQNELLNPDSLTNSSSNEVILLHLDGDELLKAYKTEYNFDENTESQIISDLIEPILLSLNNNNEKLHVVSNITTHPLAISTYLKDQNESFGNNLVSRINQKLTLLTIDHNNLVILDFQKLIHLHGYKNLVDYKFWYLGRIRYNNFGFKLIASEFTNVCNAYHGNISKVLILDLDNTLWGGVAGEDGINGIQLSEDGVGKAYRDFQKIIQASSKYGIIIAIASKNNESDVENIFKNHHSMVLKYDDFIIKKVNWGNKASSIIQIAEELNLGLNSIVFIDDSPYERDIVKQNIPEVAVPDFPKDPTLLKTWYLEDVLYKYFPRIRLSDEDINKNRQYENNFKRKKHSENIDLKSYISSLDIKLNFHRNDKNIITRLAQLTQKTNQFNLTTRRYTESDIESMMNNSSYRIYGIEYEDRFGNEGVVGEVILKWKEQSVIIDTFLLSCRVIGRDVEYLIIKEIIKDIKKVGKVSQILGYYSPTEKNIIVKNLYTDFDFQTIDHHEFIYELNR
jgi:FkbH-like protein